MPTQFFSPFNYINSTFYIYHHLPAIADYDIYTYCLRVVSRYCISKLNQRLECT